MQNNNNKIVQIENRNKLQDCFVEDESPLVEPGIYDLAYIYHTTSDMFGNKKAPKLTMCFQILDYGDYYETILPRYYNVSRHIGKKGKYGNFKVGKKSDFAREFMNIFPSYNAKRLDRLPVTFFENVIIRGRVDTVERDYKQRNRHKALHYSVIKELLEVKKI